MAEAPAVELPVVQGQEYRVKLGKSFTFPKENAFHTIKCKLCPKLVLNNASFDSAPACGEPSSRTLVGE